MTDGTSQGLFIVTAIVIFGIFVVLAYILFEDTLSPAMASMFTIATEQAHTRLDKWKQVNYVSVASGTDFEEIIEHKNNSIHYKSNGNPQYGDGISLGGNNFEPNNEYRLTFTVKQINGKITTFGGHLHFSENQELFVNGEKVNRKFKESFIFPEDTDTIDVELIFDTNNMFITEDGKYLANDSGGVFNAGISITSNRNSKLGGEIFAHEAKISNIKLYKK